MRSLSSGRDMGSLGIRIFIERFDFWEGSQAFLPLSNRSANRVTTGVVVFNHTDADANHDNFVDVAAGDAAGDLPAACIIDAMNNGVAYSMDSLIVNQNVNSSPASFASIIEGTGTADGTCSGGSKKVITVNSATDTEYGSWSISQANLQYAAGNDFMVMMRLANVLAAGDIVAHVALYNSGGTQKILDCPAIQLPASQGMIEMGVLTLPPVLAGVQWGFNGMLLKLFCKLASGSRNVEIDYLHLAAMDGYRRFWRVGRTWLTDESCCDDGLTQTAYLLNHDSGWVTPNFTALGNPFYLFPGVQNRFHFLHTGVAPSEIDRTTSITIQYKPRKRNL